MKIKIVCAGRKLRDFEQAWIDDYARRLGKFVDFEIVRIKEVAKFSLKGSRKIALSPEGTSLNTLEFRKLIENAESSTKGICFLIGGASGLSEEVKSSAEDCISLTPLTLPHRLALLVLVEQLYRVYSWKSGSPYHK